MKTTALLTFSICLFTTLMSCEREDPDSLTISVVEKGTNKPISNALVEVFRNRINESPVGKDIYDKLYTDHQGEVYIDASKGGVPLRVEVYSPNSNYYDRKHSSGFGSADITYPFRKNPVIELIPFSWITIEVQWELFKGKYDYIQWQGPHYVDRTTFYFDQILEPIRWFGNQHNTLKMFGFKNGDIIDIWDNIIYCPGHDTIYHVIEPIQ